jgi:hypothetical protein
LRLLDLMKAVAQADVIAVLVKHHEFMQPANQQQLRDLSALDFCGALA